MKNFNTIKPKTLTKIAVKTKTITISKLTTLTRLTVTYCMIRKARSFCSEINVRFWKDTNVIISITLDG